MLRQLLISVFVILAAGAAYYFLVPGAPQTLQQMGIPVPADATATATPQGGGPGGRGGGRGFGGGNREMVVVTEAVTSGKINDRLTAIGEGAAAQSVTVMAPASGRLVELAVAPGQRVQAGDVIGRLDAEAEEIAFERASLALQDAETALRRTQELANANSATTVQLNAAQLAVNTAQLESRNAELALSRRTITSPIAGTVGLYQVSAGNQVSAQSVVTTVEDTSHIVVSYWVPERYAPMVSAGMSLTASAVALPGIELAGEVTAIDNRIDPASRTLKVEARVANADGRLRPGMSFSVAMSFPGDDYPVVDPLSIQWSSDGAYLWKLVDDKVERVNLTIIQRNSDGVLVEAALEPGDQVVVQGVQQLSEGATVRLLDAPIAAAGDRPDRPVGEGRAQPNGSAL